MKKNNSTNYSEPYRYMGLNKVTSPKNTAKDQPRASQIKGSGDLRGGKAK